MVDGFVHPDFGGVVEIFRKQFDKPGAGGAAMALTQRGEMVADVWMGSVDEAGTLPWSADTVAMSFSTTKGVASTALHILADRGLLSYDEPVATYWPEFAAAGKEAITVRDLMTHRAGLHRASNLVDDPRDLLDQRRMAALLAAMPADTRRRRTSGYHAVSYGWLVSELVLRITGETLAEFVQTEIAEPIGAEGLFIGLPAAQRARMAPLFPGITAKQKARFPALVRFLNRFERTRPLADALLVEGLDDLYEGPNPPIADTEMAALNGFFTARSLAKMYGAIANGGEFGGHRLLGPDTIADFARTQVTTRDYVLLFSMRWRTGYHRAFTAGRQPPNGFGHFGFGGSGGFADLDTGMSVALTLNRVTPTTPVADIRLARIGAAALKAGRRRRR
ncbi:MAG TPA: serine hydrolase domain-containing protein [Acidimicrobiales bacterium]|nr:serine hydrolase domain-containing protein [Acidimicrobiales bacterium]